MTVKVIDIASELGRAAYNAYRENMPSNALMWRWDELTQPVRVAWQQAAMAAASEARRVIDGARSDTRAM